MKCLLCENKTGFFRIWQDKEYFKCSSCHCVMVNPKDYMSQGQEKERYETHNNDVDDPGYQAFVSPIVDAVLRDYDKNHKGLDFGSGPGPVITKMLRDQGYTINIYDPFFANNKERLKETYDYIVCCEVMEHFHDPKMEFKKLKEMLKPGGTLYLKTKIYKDGLDFDSWGYKNDSTHVFFYHPKGLKYIKRQYEFSEMSILEELITYKRSL